MYAPTPWLPSAASPQAGQLAPLRALASELRRLDATLSARVSAGARPGLVEALALVNSYYSNRIEGNPTRLRDIERTLAARPADRNRHQHAHAAWLRAHAQLDERAKALPVAGIDFINRVHADLYDGADPAALDLHNADGKILARMTPGALRPQQADAAAREVQIGLHDAPPAVDVRELLQQLFAAVNAPDLTGDWQLIAAACLHHRLSWIHPYPDGNGRVNRLQTDAWLRHTCGLEGYGLWSMSRGFARQVDDYMQALRAADRERTNDLDGRGNLSERGLLAFCEYFLRTAVDQASFMSESLDAVRFHERLDDWATRGAGGFDVARKISVKHVQALELAWTRGHVSSALLASRINATDRTAQYCIRDLLTCSQPFLVDVGGGRYAMRFPMAACEHWFPRLFSARDLS